MDHTTMITIVLIAVAALVLVWIVWSLHPIRFIKCRKQLKIAAADVISESGFAYEPKQDIFVSEFHAWQRAFGYTRAYDTLMPFICVIADSEPVYFDCDGKSWLIQLWKGQYGITSGFEVGVYNTVQSGADKASLQYQSVSDEEMPWISFCGIKKEKPYFSRPLQRHWWLTGFRMGDFCKPNQLAMEVMLLFQNDNMATAFYDALRKLGYTDVRQYNCRVQFRFDRPHSKQPSTRNALLDFVILGYDWILVKLYRGATFILGEQSVRRWRRCFGWTARARLK